ncbi:MAG TPA: hypothetical protein VHL34_09920 [Rhizomicrobium sp.]|nr:hypothetical protein [Rhizomicrobium sp.]
MRTILAAAVAGGLLLGNAYAADAGQANAEPNNNAVNTSGTNNSMTPVAGANSFTEAQAKSRIEARGYTHVHGLKKDGNGVWRGTATKDGHSGPVSLDFQGNVN